MPLLSASLLILGLTAGSPAWAETDAYARLESVHPSDPGFVDALLELQKIHYANQDWQKFFGYAAFYRRGYLSRSERLSKDFNARLISLEVMALVKHCAWKEAREIAGAAVTLARAQKLAGLQDLEEAAAHVELAGTVPAAIAGQEATQRPAPVFTDHVLWKIGDSAFKQVAHPRSLRVLFSSRCPSEKRGPASSSEYALALSELSRGENASAYPRLEKAFLAETGERKGRIASLLAVADSTMIRGPRFVYARAALESKIELSAGERLRLWRIVGDGLFDRGDLRGAKEGYLNAMKVTPIAGLEADHEYVRYKLGWVWMNENQPGRAYQLWSDWIESHPGGTLRSSFLKDMGRAWMEISAGKSGRPKLASSLNEEETGILLKGLEVGARRQGKTLEDFAGDVAPLIEKVSMTGMERWSKARILKRAGRFELACRELEVFAADASVRDELAPRRGGLIAEVLESCDRSGKNTRELLVRYMPLEQVQERWSKRLWLGLLSEAHEWRTIWLNWNTLGEELTREPRLVRALYGATLAAFSEYSDLPLPQYFSDIKKLLDIETPLQAGLKPVPPAEIRDHRLVSDIRRLLEMRGIESQYEKLSFAAGPKLSKKIMAKISPLKRQMMLAKRHEWGSKLFLGAADRSLKKMSLNLASAIDALVSGNQVTDAVAREELTQLGGVIRTWSLGVKSDEMIVGRAPQSVPATKARASRVIDVGDVEVKGELRKPFVQVLDADRATREALPKLSTEQLKAYEAKLLRPEVKRGAN